MFGEFFDVVEIYYFDMKCGIYFFFFEWYNFDWKLYGYDYFNKIEIFNISVFFGGLVMNLFIGEKEFYIGWILVDDFIIDMMVF